MPELNIPKSPEVPRSPEASLEGRERPEAAPSAETEPAAESQPADSAVAPAPSAPLKMEPPKKDPELMRVERVLEGDLGDIYVSLPKDVRVRFRAKGEEVAQTLRAMIDSAKVSAKKVLEIISEWLKLIPGVNRFFLEQEAKIKTDRIMALADERKKEAQKQA